MFQIDRGVTVTEGPYRNQTVLLNKGELSWWKRSVAQRLPSHLCTRTGIALMGY